jgi:hypothetical integral membrane protein (TIGR02206 family)
VSDFCVHFVLAATNAPAFVPFSATHVVTSLLYAFAAVSLMAAGWMLRANAARLRTLTQAWCWFVVLVQAINIGYWTTPPRLEPASSLPLHICDLAGIFAALSMIAIARGTPVRVLRITVLYWGLGLSSQAFVTPIITDGPDTLRFHIFFLSHFTIVATPLFDIAAHALVPTWRDLRLVTLVTIIYGAIVIPLNALTGWNYGFAGPSKPDSKTLIDALGPYPLRLLWLFVIALSIYVALTCTLRWLLVRNRTTSTHRACWVRPARVSRKPRAQRENS